MDYEVKRVHEHFEIYINGEFYCTADNMAEVREEIENYESRNRGDLLR